LETRYVSKIGTGGKVLVARLKPGSDLLLSIRSLAEKEGIVSGVILSGVGLLRAASLRNCKSFPDQYPITDVNRTFLRFEKPLEILSLTGNVSGFQGKPSVHAHITLSYVEHGRISVIGGHLIEGCLVFGFAEIFLMELEKVQMTKEFDEETKTHQLFV